MQFFKKLLIRYTIVILLTVIVPVILLSVIKLSSVVTDLTNKTLPPLLSASEYNTNQEAKVLLVDDDTVAIVGVISNDTVIKFQNILATNIVNDVIIISGGGVAYSGIKLGTILLSEELNVYAPSECHSACTFAFLGGINRYISKDTIMGFHNAGWELTKSEYSLDEVHAYIESVGHFTGNMTLWFHHRGVPMEFIYDVVITPYTKILYVESPNLIKYKIATSVI